MKYEFSKQYIYPAVAVLLISGWPLQLWSEEKNRIGYIDLEYVFANSNLRDTAYKEFQAQKERLVQGKKAAEASLAKLRKELRDRESLLGAEEYQKDLKDIELKTLELEKTILQSKEDLRKWEQDTLATLYDDITVVMEIISREEKMPVILSRQNAILYGDSSLDMSQRAIDLINELDERNTPAAK